MKTKHIVAVLGVLALLAFASAASAATGNLKVKLVDTNGVTVNGTVTAQQGTNTATRKSCTTAAGTCTLVVDGGKTWTVTASTAGGKRGGPSPKAVVSGSTVTLTVQVK